MKADKHEAESAESEIALLKELLPKLSSEYLAFIKGASKALLYAQENMSLSQDPDNPGFNEQRD